MKRRRKNLLTTMASTTPTTSLTSPVVLCPSLGPDSNATIPSLETTKDVLPQSLSPVDYLKQNLEL